MLKALRDTDVRHLLPRVAVPTLVLHRRGDQAVRIAAGRDMASQITGAQFVELDGNDHWFFAGAQQPVLAAIKQFVDALPRGRKPAPALFPERTRKCCLLPTQLFLGPGEGRFDHVADRLPGAAIELNQSHLLDRPEIPGPVLILMPGSSTEADSP